MNSKTSIEQDQTIDELAAEVEEEQGGKKVSQVKRDFAVLKVMSPGKSNAQIAREVGTYAQPAKMGHQLAHDPSVNALQEKLEAVMDFPINESNPERWILFAIEELPFNFTSPDDLEACGNRFIDWGCDSDPKCPPFF